MCDVTVTVTLSPTCTASQASDLSGEFLAEDRLECFPVLGELLDAFVELVKGHLLLEEGPAEFGFVVDKGDFFDGLELGGYQG